MDFLDSSIFVPVIHPDNEDEARESLYVTIMLIAKVDLGKTIEALEVAKQRCRLDEVVKYRAEETP